MEDNTQTTTPAAPSSGSSQSSSQGSPSRGVQVWQRSETSGPQTSTPETQQQQAQPAQPAQQRPVAQVDQMAQSQQVRQQAAQQGVDPRELAKAIVEAQTLATQRQKPAYTPEQFKQDFGIFEMDGPTFESMFGVEASPERIEAFNHMIKRTVAMSVKMATFQAQQQIEKIQASLNPIQATMKEAQNRAVYQQFSTKHPELKPYTALVQSVVAQMKQQGAKFKTVDEAISAAAQRTKAMLQQSGVQIQASPQQQQQPRQKQPAMVSTGGSVGTGRSTSPTQQSRGLAVLKRSMGSR